MKIILILLGLLLIFSCKETIIEKEVCTQEKSIRWDYKDTGQKVGFKIYSGRVNPDTLIATINPATPPVTNYTYIFDMCQANYILIEAFDDQGNVSTPGPVVCIGSGCRPYNENKNLGTSKEPPPNIILQLTY